MSSLLLLTVALGVLWVVWKAFFRFALKHPLDNIPGPPRESLIEGHMGRFLRKDSCAYQDELCDQYGSVCKIDDLFGKRALFVSDPQALQSILLRDQDIYEESSWLVEWNKIIFGKSLLSTHGAVHRKQRKLLNPVFSIAHMRHLTPIFYGVAERLADAISAQISTEDGQDVDILRWVSRAALELIGQGGLGYSFDPLVEDRKNEFGDALTRLFPVSFELALFQMLSPYYLNIGTPTFRRSILDRIPIPKVQELKDIVDAMDDHSRAIFYSKKAALEKGDAALAEQVGQGQDVLSVMLRANTETSTEDRLDDEELIAQMSTIVFGATDTTSNTLARILYLLATHPEAQERLRGEISRARQGDRLSYDDLMALPYLDAVCRETLRAYPPVTLVLREARQDVLLPLSKPLRGNDDTVVDQIFVPQGTTVVIAIQASNRNKALWGDDAHQWNPERWLSSLPDSVLNARIPGVYSSLMSFIGGGRSCIGFKFAELEMKVVLSTLLERYTFSLSSQDVFWNLAAVVYPSVGEYGSKPSLPLQVRPAVASPIGNLGQKGHYGLDS